MAHFTLYYVLLELSEQNELGGVWVPDTDLNLVKSSKPWPTCLSWCSSLLTFGTIIVHDSMPRTVQTLPYLVLFNSYKKDSKITTIIYVRFTDNRGWGTERLNNLPRITWQENDGVEITSYIQQTLNPTDSTWYCSVENDLKLFTLEIHLGNPQDLFIIFIYLFIMKFLQNLAPMFFLASSLTITP